MQIAIIITSIMISKELFTITADSWCLESGEEDNTVNTINPVVEKANNKIPGKKSTYLLYTLI